MSQPLIIELSNERITELTGIDVDGLIRKAESGADWAQIARVEADAKREHIRRSGSLVSPIYEIGG